MEIIINNRFIIDRKIGNGAFGDIFNGYDKKTGKLVAIKLENIKKKPGKPIMLAHEYSIYNELNTNMRTNTRIPRVHWYGIEGDYSILIMDLMGNTLESLFNLCKRKFSLKTTLMIGIQMLDIIEYIHQNSYIHRDLKPENFLLGINENRHYLYLIDFGLGKRFKNNNKQHCELQSGKKLVGTARYASVNSHNGLELSRRDDLESLFYNLLYFLNGTLPWMGLPGKTRDEKYTNIKDTKNKITVMELCQGLPIEFTNFINHVKSLKFNEKPNYRYLKSLCTDLMIQNNFRFDYNYDWSTFNPNTGSPR